jgi:hypothetical protein
MASRITLQVVYKTFRMELENNKHIYLKYNFQTDLLECSILITFLKSFKHSRIF